MMQRRWSVLKPWCITIIRRPGSVYVTHIVLCANVRCEPVHSVVSCALVIDSSVALENWKIRVFYRNYFFNLTLYRCAFFIGSSVLFATNAPVDLCSGTFFYDALVQFLSTAPVVLVLALRFIMHQHGRVVRHRCSIILWCTRHVRMECMVSSVPITLTAPVC